MVAAAAVTEWIRMTGWDRLRVIAVSASTVVTALVNVLSNRGGRTSLACRPGDVAPDFGLAGSDGRSYRLADFRGREAVVLAWFPKAFTLGCTAECESLASSANALEAYAVQCFGISVDTPEANRRFADAMRLPYPLLSDPGGHVARAYGVFGPAGFASRTTFYIGTDGRILDVDRNVNAPAHGARVAARLAQLGVPKRPFRTSGAPR
jgi:peroxiredoxin Q/BCP